MPLKRLLHRLLHSQEGAATLEFGLTSVLLFMIIFALIEYSLITIGQSVVENAALDAARAGITGFVPEGATREEYIKSIISQNSMLLTNPDKLSVTSVVYDNLTQVGQAEPLTNDVNGNGAYDAGDSYTDVNGNGQWDGDIGLPGLGESEQVVLYTITYQWDVMMPFLGDLLGKDGVVNITSSTLVKNEPFTIE